MAKHSPLSVRPSTSLAAFTAMTFGNVALAFGPLFVRMADVGPVASGFWRIALAAPVLALAALATGWRPSQVTRSIWAFIILAGLCFAADLASWHYGILRTTLANATLFGNSAILMFPVYGFIVAGALPSRIQGTALLLALIGAVLLMGQSYSLDPRHLAGDLFCLLAGSLYTAYFVLMACARETLAPLATLAMSTVAGVAPLLCVAWLLGEKIMPDHWGPLIALAFFSQVVGQGLMVFALGKLPPLVVGIGLLVQPVVAAAIGWIAYHEQLGPADLIGAVLVGVALVLVRRPAAVPPKGQLGAAPISG